MSNRTSQQLRLRPTLVDETILFNGDELSVPTHRPIRVVGQGKNGFVVLCHNELLNRPEALKVWARLDPKDSRDKFKQGLDEARKAVTASQGRSVAQIYSAGVLLEKYLYATMEYVQGPTLHDYLAEHKDERSRHWLATGYITVLTRGTDGVLHGDAHARNVIVERVRDRTNLKLLDFGTSRFTGSEKFVERHWRVVGETIRYILGNSQQYKSAKHRVDKIPDLKSINVDQYYTWLVSFARRDD
jgi:serine/threonine protein kinase